MNFKTFYKNCFLVIENQLFRSNIFLVSLLCSANLVTTIIAFFLYVLFP
jgi:hypothetical protein